MNLYRVRNKERSWYGESIGILVLNTAYPCVPGNIANASTFPFPVRYKEVKDATTESLVNQMDESLLKGFIDAAIELQKEGVKAITGACGYMALFQKEVADLVDIPVFLSSLLQIPFIHRTLKNSQKIGVICANASSLTKRHLESVGVGPEIPIVVAGMEKQKEFREAISEEKGTLDSCAIEKEVLSVVNTMIRDHPGIGALLLECSDLPPYAQAVQNEFSLPVFDFFTMINFVHTAVVRKKFDGFM